VHGRHLVVKVVVMVIVIVKMIAMVTVMVMAKVIVMVMVLVMVMVTTMESQNRKSCCSGCVISRPITVFTIKIPHLSII
jgi:hypothetical protein